MLCCSWIPCTYPAWGRFSREALFVTLLFSLVILPIFCATRASAISAGEELVRFGEAGSEAGQVTIPRSGATDSVTGHVYVSDPVHSRINEFTAWGGFVKAFGWDVAPGAVNEQQEVRVRAVGGQFRLSFGSGGPGVSETGNLSFDASAAEVQAALNSLSNISGGGGNVAVTEITGTPNGLTPYVYVITFKGSLAATNVAQIAAASGTTPLVGGQLSSEVEVRTRADGTAGGTGLEACTAESGCKAGTEGGEAGQVSTVLGMAVSPGGDVYVKEQEYGKAEFRVQKFSSSGRFQLMLGAGVDKGPHHPGNLCTAAYIAEGDSCGAGSSGSGPGEFSAQSTGVAVGPDGTTYVTDDSRIQEFEPNGVFKGEVKLPGKVVGALALNRQGSKFYVTFREEKNVHVLDASTGIELGHLVVENPRDVAVDGEGNVFVVDVGGVSQGVADVLQFDSSGKSLDPPILVAGEPIPGHEDASPFDLGFLAANSLGDVYVGSYSSTFIIGFIIAFGPAPVSFEGPPPSPPTINAQFATTVERTGATVSATINPHFWTDTRYYVQYGTGKCSEGGCESQRPVPPGSLLTSKPQEAFIHTAGVFLEGLSPGTTYHYRFVAKSGGGESTGEEASFTTFPAALGKQPCANDVFRFGFSAPLPDCRAYEMVSPVDKGGGDVIALLDGLSYSTALNQSSTSGERLTYTSSRAFADPKAAPYAVQYLASRGEGGWDDNDISPPQGIAAGGGDGTFYLDSQYRAFSPDLCQALVLVAAEPPLAPGGNEHETNLYRRQNCGAG